MNKQAQRYLAYKHHVGWSAKQAKIKQLQGDVEVYSVAYLFGKREPDVDNLAKAFLDSLNGIAWVDDRQVRKLTIEKRKASSRADERAEICIQEIGCE